MSRGLFPGQGAAPQQPPARGGDALGVWLGPASAPLTQPASPASVCAGCVSPQSWWGYSAVFAFSSFR